jgi:tetraprenyl-beta-curcumene synthase
MMTRTFFEVLPSVHSNLDRWKEKAGAIPDPELRRQALMSIATKTFHCEGGSLYGMLAGRKGREAIRFIVAYQTISDYLDNLCDRSTSLDPSDFRSLHESMFHALTPGAAVAEYYRFRREQDDGGYLAELVKTCQGVLGTLQAYPRIAPYLHELAGYYCDLQVHKHVKPDERVPRLRAWFEGHKNGLPEMSWYEFSACAGSTLGIFCLVSAAFQGTLSGDLARRIRKAYFPWVQGLHILMDYFVDQDEDLRGGDLNFCFYYESREWMWERLALFFREACSGVSQLPSPKFHRMICQGLLAVYLADRKVARQGWMGEMVKNLLQEGGALARIFYLNCWVYRRLMERQPSAWNG